MNKDETKKTILEISIFIIIVLVVIIIRLFSQNKDSKYNLLYLYLAIPHIELTNTLTPVQGGLSGEVRGFVKFDNIADQPTDSRQYYIIKPLDKFKVSENVRQYFSLEEIIKMQALSPRSVGLSLLVEVSETANTIILEDKIGNKFFIDKSTKRVSMVDATGESSTLITSDKAYGDFIEGWLRK